MELNELHSSIRIETSNLNNPIAHFLQFFLIPGIGDPDFRNLHILLGLGSDAVDQVALAYISGHEP